jgi:DNA-binding SARP family transcriptional activator
MAHAGVRIGILGPLAVVCNEEQVRTLPAGLRAVLGLLALAGGSSVRTDALIDVLWGEEPPPSATGILYTYMSRIRQILDPVRLPPRDGTGYRLNVAADELDLLTFRRDVSDARAAAAAGDAARACGCYAQALGLWRGSPVEDVDSLRGHPAVLALQNERVAAVLEYADVAAGNGRDDQVLSELRTLAACDPLNEAARAKLMIVLAGAGRQAEALQEYEDLRQRLDEQLGVLPGVAVREAHAKVLRQDLPAAIDRQSWLPVFQMPAALADFTGRAADCEKLISAISQGASAPGVPIVVVSGQPGIGKTTLSLFAAHKLRDRFPDGQLWVQLTGASARPREPADVLGELLRALGVPGSAVPDAITERAACFRSCLAARRILIVADDARSVAQVRPLVPGTAGCALIVTSRSQLEGLDGAHLLPIDVMAPEEAADLLARVVGQGRVAAEPDAAGELVQACGALPLALRIVGARLAARPSWPVSAMVQKIADDHGRLRELEAGDLSVRASIASSYAPLSGRVRRAFRLLSLLGPADFAEWVVAVLLGEAEAGDVIGDLVGRSLLMPIGVDACGEPRYRLHDLLRDFAAERLDDDPGDRDEAMERLLRAWLQLATLADAQLPAEPYFPPPPDEPWPSIVLPRVAQRLTKDAIAWFISERVNLMAAAEQACATRRADMAGRLAHRMCAYFHLQDRHDDAERLWQIVADAAARSDEGVYARFRLAASMVERGRAPDALAILNGCVQDLERQGDLEILSLALYWRGSCSSDLDDYEPARRDAERAIGVARQAESVFAEGMSLRALATVLAMQGKSEMAIEASELALAISARLGNPTYEVAALHTLSFCCARGGLPDRAIRVSMRRMELSRELGDIRAVGGALGIMGDAYQAQGNYELAIESWLQALPGFRDHRADRFTALCLQKLGCAYEALDRHQQAAGCLQESLQIFRRLGVSARVSAVQQALDRCQAAITASPAPGALQEL